MYEIMRYWDEDHSDWDAEDRDFAAAWRGKPKWVVSRLRRRRCARRRVRDQPFEAWITFERRPRRVDPEPRGRDEVRFGEQLVDLVKRVRMIAECDVEPCQDVPRVRDVEVLVAGRLGQRQTTLALPHRGRALSEVGQDKPQEL